MSIEKQSFAPRFGLTEAHRFCRRRDPAANAGFLPAQKQKLRPEVGAPTGRAKSSTPRSGLHTSATRTAFVGGAIPRRRRAFCPPKAKASPRDRGSHRKGQKLQPEIGTPQKRYPHRFCRRRDPAPKAGFLPAQKQKLRPEVGAPTGRAKSSNPRSGLPQNRYPHRFCRRRDPAPNAGFLPAQSKSFAPRSGLPQERPKASPQLGLPQNRYPHRFCRRRDPAPNAGFLPAQSKSFAPRSGLPQEGPKAPTRDQGFHKTATHTAFVGGATPRRRRAFCPPKAKASPRGRDSHRKGQKLRPEVGAPTEPLPTPLYRRRDPAPKAGFLPAQKQKLRPEVGAPTGRAKSSNPRSGLPQNRYPHRFCRRRDPAPKAGFLPAQKQKLRLAVGAPTGRAKSSNPRSGLPQNRYPHRFCRRRDPAPSAGFLPAQKQKLRPEVGAPTGRAKSFAPRSVLPQERGRGFHRKVDKQVFTEPLAHILL